MRNKTPSATYRPGSLPEMSTYTSSIRLAKKLYDSLIEIEHTGLPLTHKTEAAIFYHLEAAAAHLVETIQGGIAALEVEKAVLQLRAFGALC